MCEVASAKNQIDDPVGVASPGFDSEKVVRTISASMPSQITTQAACKYCRLAALLFVLICAEPESHQTPPTATRGPNKANKDLFRPSYRNTTNLPRRSYHNTTRLQVTPLDTKNTRQDPSWTTKNGGVSQSPSCPKSPRFLQSSQLKNRVNPPSLSRVA